MNNEEIFKLNEQLYTKLASYNDKYHLYSTNCNANKERTENCVEQQKIIDNEYSEVKNDIEGLLQLLKNSENGMSRDVDFRKKINQNNELRIKLQNDLDQLYFDKTQNNRHDIDIEAGLLWILLTTSCIYFVLFKL